MRVTLVDSLSEVPYRQSVIVFPAEATEEEKEVITPNESIGDHFEDLLL